jgi:hypothetical protein
MVANLILHDLIYLITFGEALLLSLIQPPDTSPLLGPNILLSILFSDTLNNNKN